MRAAWLMMFSLVACDGVRTVPTGPPRTASGDSGIVSAGDGASDASLNDGSSGGDASVGRDASPGVDVGPLGGAVDPPTFCAINVELGCQATQNCCSDPAHRYGSLDECRQAQAALCGFFSGVAFMDGRIQWDAHAAGDVLAQEQVAVQACQPFQPGGNAFLTGTVPAGGSCSPAGTDFSPALACAAGTNCHLTNNVGTCQTKAGLGSPCSNATCVPGAFCDTLGTHNCVPQKPNSVACMQKSECQSNNCASQQCAPTTADSAYCRSN